MAKAQPSTEQPSAIDELLNKSHQTQLLRFWPDLSESQKSRLLAQIEAIDFDQIAALAMSKTSGEELQLLAEQAGPPQAIRHDDQIQHPQAERLAHNAISEGKVGVVMVAGGQGSRLGFPYPKGMFPIGPISNRTLFEFHLDQLKAISRRYRCEIPLYIMTSPATHDDTVSFFEAADRFGLHPRFPPEDSEPIGPQNS